MIGRDRADPPHRLELDRPQAVGEFAQPEELSIVDTDHEVDFGVLELADAELREMLEMTVDARRLLRQPRQDRRQQPRADEVLDHQPEPSVCGCRIEAWLCAQRRLHTAQRVAHRLDQREPARRELHVAAHADQQLIVEVFTKPVQRRAHGRLGTRGRALLHA